MAKKQHSIDLPRYVTAYRRDGKVRFKYLRRVPLAVQATLCKRVWDFSLGSSLPQALEKAENYRLEHDELIRKLKDPVAAFSYGSKQRSQVASAGARYVIENKLAGHFITFDGNTFSLTTSPENGRISLDGALGNNQELWRHTKEMLDEIRSLPPDLGLTLLVHFAAYAFGDKSHLDKATSSEPYSETLVEVLEPRMPDDPTETLIFEAYRSALERQISVLWGKDAASEKYRLSVLREQYLNLRSASPKTRQSYISKTNRLIDFLGDLPLNHLTPEMLRKYRDHLGAEELSAGSVAQYFAPLKSILRWAISEDLVPGLDSMPTDKVSMPRNRKTVEAIRWQRFDDQQIKDVWSIAQKAWGPQSRLSLARQRAYPLAFKVMLYTAMRPVEVFQLVPENVTADRIHILETKTGISRTLPLSKHISEFFRFMQDEGFHGCGSPTLAARKMSETFSTAIRAEGFTNDRHVLYSLKDTLVARLQLNGEPDDVIRAVTGHVSGQGYLRNYKTRLNDTPEGLEMIREALDRIEYW